VLVRFVCGVGVIGGSGLEWRRYNLCVVIGIILLYGVRCTLVANLRL